MIDRDGGPGPRAWHVVELTFASMRRYGNPYTDVELRVTLTSPDGEFRDVSGFWDGDDTWRARFAPWQPGTWAWRSAASDPDNAGLHERRGTVDVLPYGGANPIFRHGFLGVHASRRGFAHHDGTPFFWLGDTVWSVAANATLEEWRAYLAHRRRQGFNVAQINTLHQWDSSGTPSRRPFAAANGGWDLARPLPPYFQYLDRIVAEAADAGIFSALVVLWFNYVPGTNPEWFRYARPTLFTPELAARYATYLAARYAALGAVWVVAGDTDWKHDDAIAIYDAAARAIRRASPTSSPMTAHLCGKLATPDDLNGRPWLDFHMFQSGHYVTGRDEARRCAAADRAQDPRRPVLNAEPCYEGIKLQDGDVIVDRPRLREVAWNSILAGGNAGLTYGAQGLWPWHRPGQPYAFGEHYGLLFAWRDALRFEGAEDVARMRRFFERLPWWDLEPANQLREASDGDLVVAATHDRGIVVAYAPRARPLTLRMSGHVRGEWLNPADGAMEPARAAVADGSVTVGAPPWDGDAVLLLRSS